MFFNHSHWKNSQLVQYPRQVAFRLTLLFIVSRRLISPGTLGGAFVVDYLGAKYTMVSVKLRIGDRVIGPMMGWNRLRVLFFRQLSVSSWAESTNSKLFIGNLISSRKFIYHNIRLTAPGHIGAFAVRSPSHYQIPECKVNKPPGRLWYLLIARRNGCVCVVSSYTLSPNAATDPISKALATVRLFWRARQVLQQFGVNSME